MASGKAACLGQYRHHFPAFVEQPIVNAKRLFRDLPDQIGQASNSRCRVIFAKDQSVRHLAAAELQ